MEMRQDRQLTKRHGIALHPTTDALSQSMQTPSKPFVIPIFIPHAGCPHRCVFCDQTSTTSQLEALPAPKQLHQDIQRFLGYRRDADRYTEISFYGGNFLGLARDTIRGLLHLAGEYVRQGDVQGIRFSTRPDTIDSGRIALIGKFPVTTVELGVQSMNNDLLTLSRRGHSVEQIRNAVNQLRRHPWRLGLQMMVGLPGEDAAAALATAKRIVALAPDFVRIYPTLVLEGSPLAHWYREGRFTPLTLDQAVSRVKSAYIRFYCHGIPVVRMGLQPTIELNHGAGVLAGPFHPAFGELVHAALWRDVLDHALGHMATASAGPVIQLHPKLLSRVKGNKNSNVVFLQRTRNVRGIQFDTREDLPLDTILVNGQAWSLPQECEER